VSTVISESSEWTFPLLERYAATIGELAAGYGLDTYANQIEVISAEQMMDAYSSVGMPINYHHWSFGKQFMHTEKGYRRGRMGLAYEIVINSDPCIAYLMEENTLPMQALVIAHACFGHNSFFKGNYLFRTWTSPDAIIDYLLFAKNYVHECEERYGDEEVESLLDSCHALMNQGVDRYKRPSPLSMREEHARQREREAYLQTQVNDLWRTLPAYDKKEDEEAQRFPTEPQENLLYFIEKNAPLLEPWQREVVRIVRKVAQYFYPQRQTQVMNEGWATFWHYTLLNSFYEQGYCTDGFMLEFLQSHTNVVYQPAYDSQYYSGHLNPYTLGFAMFRDLRRICERPTDEDRHWFPHLADTDWLKQADFAMRNFKDESFIAQYLSPVVIRDLKLFDVLDDDSEEQLEIAAIHDNEGYRRVRTALADQYNLHSREPNIQVYRVDQRGDRSLTLRHTQYNRRPLNAENAAEVLKHLRRLWGFTVRLETVDDKENVEVIGEL
jgi:stage V sporulation protein R